jgi:hypothetical protein
MLPSVSFADVPNFNKEQLDLRTDVFNFLKVEGYMPEIDSDGDIKFKSQGQEMYFSVSESNTNPMHVILFMYFSKPSGYSEECILKAGSELNKQKGAKVVFFDDSFMITSEMFVRHSEAVLEAFYSMMENIEEVKDNFIDYCDTYNSTPVASISEIPFIITKFEVANVDYNNNIIQDYGVTIWDNKSQYLKPRITVKPLSGADTYTITIKLYQNNKLYTGKSTDYTYTNDISVSGQSGQVISLTGWGSSTSGFWPAGNYRFEIWYGDYCLGSKSFKVI